MVELPFALENVPENAWIKTYVDYASKVAPITPRIFHESAALWLLSTAIARRVVLRIYFGDVYPNLFILWCAPTTVWRKTTALNIARKIAYKNIPHLLAPHDATLEAMISDMAGREPNGFGDMTSEEKDKWRMSRNYAAQKGLLIDEISGMLSAAKKDYMAGTMETYLKLYDCLDMYEKSTRGQGHVTVHDTYLTMIGASTPVGLEPYVDIEYYWSLGMWPRFALLCPDGKPVWTRSGPCEMPEIIPETVRKIAFDLPEAKWPNRPAPLDVQFGDGVYDLWELYDKTTYTIVAENKNLDQRLAGTYGRLPTQVLKVAMCLAMAEQKLVITKRVFWQAMHIVEGWRISAHRFLEMPKENGYDKITERIIELLAAGEMSFRALQRAMSTVSAKDLEYALKGLKDTKTIDIRYVKASDKGGRPTWKYFLI